MPKLQVGDVIRWRGLHGHEGVIVHFFNGRAAAVCYASAPDEVKYALLSDLQLAEGPISDEMQNFIDGVAASR